MPRGGSALGATRAEGHCPGTVLPRGLCGLQVREEAGALLPAGLLGYPAPVQPGRPPLWEHEPDEVPTQQREAGMY